MTSSSSGPPVAPTTVSVVPPSSSAVGQANLHQLSAVLTAHTVEYSALRDEVCAFHNVEGQIMSITIALIGALTAFTSAVLGGQIAGFTFGQDVGGSSRCPRLINI
jgi:hypothetical protein